MKNPVSQVRPRIVSYSELDAPLSIDPVLDGGLKLDILDCLNNKANSAPYLKLASEPTPAAPTIELGSNGDYYILLSTPNLVFVKASGAWNAVEKVNTMFFYADTIDGVRKYYAFDDALENTILVHSIDFGNPGGESVKYTPQTLTTPQKTQARINIDAASQAYIDNAIAALKNSGAIGNSVAGSVMPWFGLESTIPKDWAKINTARIWYSKTEYAQLYQALGGENNPFGLTSTTFSIPWFPTGTSIVQSGGIFVRGTNGGEQEVILTKDQTPSTKSQVPGITGGDNSDNNNQTRFAGGDKPNGQGTNFLIDVNSDGGGKSHNNMPPYSPAMWIIKLKNTGGSFTASIDRDGHLILTFDDGTTQDAGMLPTSGETSVLSTTNASANVLIPIPSDIWISSIKILVTGGIPTINIPAISSGDMSGEAFYPNIANLYFPTAGDLQVNVSGGDIKIQVIKHNI